MKCNISGLEFDAENFVEGTGGDRTWIFGADFGYSDIGHSRVHDVDFAACRFDGAVSNWGYFGAVGFLSSSFTDALFSGTHFDGCEFIGCDLDKLRLQGCTFSDCVFFDCRGRLIEDAHRSKFLDCRVKDSDLKFPNDVVSGLS